jgi:uracil-DNA glycosylase
MACFFEEEETNKQNIKIDVIPTLPIESKSLNPEEWLWEQIPQDYQLVLQQEKTKQYWKGLSHSVFEAYQNSKISVYPPWQRLFYALVECPFENVKVVCIGQDPYHGKGQANGLCFSTQKGLRVQPSLANIYEELERDLKIKRDPMNGDLTGWAKQGVLLLNAGLSVEDRRPMSHSHFGWQNLTDAILQAIDQQKKDIVFLLWGKVAQAKADNLNRQKHCILMTSHPSPYSVTFGFENCKHFSQTNNYLQKTKQTPIDWAL